MMTTTGVLPGLIGLGLSLALWLLSSWRLVFHTFFRRRTMTTATAMTGREDDEQQQHYRTTCATWITRRRTFHTLLWMAMSCEAVAYADISGLLPLNVDRFYAEQLGYVLLDMAGRSVLELLAFSTVTFMWLDTAIQASPTRSPAVISFFFDANTSSSRTLWHEMRRYLLPVLFTVATSLLVLSSTAVSVVLILHSSSDTTDQDADPYGNLMTFLSHLPLSRIQVLLEALSWGLHSLVVLQCLDLTSKRICLVSAAFPPHAWWRRLSLSSKALLPMLVCSLCYALRCGWLVYQFIIGMKTDTAPSADRTTTARFETAWWIGFMWSPTFIVVAMLLYSARKRDHFIVTIDANLRNPLLASPVPPAEAFLAFSRHRMTDNEYCADDSLFGSPMPHVIPTQGIEVADEETLSTDSERANQTRVEPN